MNNIKTPFIISILFHSMVLFSVAAFYKPAKEALMDVTPLEFVQLAEEKETVQPEKESQKEIAIPKKAEIAPLQARVEEKQEEIENQEIKPVQDIRTDTNESMEREQLVPPLPAVADSGVIDTQDVYTYTAPADDNIPDTANKINRFTNMVRSKIEKAKFYPRWARERGYEGVVGVQFVILPDGKVGGVKVVRPCHCEILNKAACEAIMKAAPFNPRSNDLGDKEIVMEVDIGFKLE